LEGLTAFVLVEVVDADLLVVPLDVVVGGVDGRGRHTGSSRPTENSAGALRRRAKLTPSKYERVEHPLRGAPVHRQVAHHLVVRLAVGHPDRALEMAEERHVGHDRDEVLACAAAANVMPPPWLPPVTAMRAASTREGCGRRR
jgi:hypothetical protein